MGTVLIRLGLPQTARPLSLRTTCAFSKTQKHLRGYGMKSSLNFRRSIRIVALFVITVPVLAQTLGCQRNEVQTELLTRNSSDVGKQYALSVKNNSKEPITFQAVPDIAFQHSSCTSGFIFSTSVTRWNSDNHRWEPIDTFISGFKASAKRNLSTKTFVLLPGRSLCGDWWADSDAAKPRA